MNYKNVMDDDDFLYCQSKFKSRPCQRALMIDTTSSDLWSILSKLDITRDNIVYIAEEVAPSEEGHMTNIRYLVKMEDDIFIRFTELDKIDDDDDSGYVAGITIFYSISKIESIKSISDEIMNSSHQMVESDETSLSNFGILKFNPNMGYYIERPKMEANDDDIDLLYNDDVVKSVPKLLRNINNERKTINIVWGERGCGKTTLVSKIVGKIKKDVILIPFYLIDFINTTEFQSFIQTRIDTVIIIDNSEICFNYTKPLNLTPYIMDIAESITYENNNIHFILIFNTKDLNSIDPNILESNQLYSMVKVDRLTKEKALVLTKKMKITIEEESIKLSEIFNKNIIHKNKIGF
jgi:hypothetical protein